jgi:hypothetical protein
MERTTAKRKRAAADITGDEPAPAAVDEASDAEVEEFYAILRRMRDASRRICGAGARPAPRVPAWRPSFCWEDFADSPPPTTPPAQARQEDEPGVPAAAEAERSAPPQPQPQPPARLDLNAEPEPEAPSAPATPRSARVPA